MQGLLWLICISLLPGFTVKRSVFVENATNIRFVDFNGDGYRDILAADDRGLTIYLADGHENFIETSGIHTSGVENFVTLDFNGDGFIDVASIQNSRILTVYKNRGVEGFSKIYEHSLTGSYFESLSVIDFNRDGILDLYVSSPLSGDVVFLSEGSFEFVPMAVNFMSDRIIPISCHRNVLSYILLSRNGIRLAEKSRLLPAQMVSLHRGNFTKVYPADLNNDGNIDIVTLENGGFLKIFTNLEDSVFGLDNVLDFDVADFDLDSYQDIVVLFSDHSVGILKNRGNFSFELNNYLSLSEAVHNPQSVFAVDMNSDLLTDLVFYNGTNLEIAYNSEGGARTVGIKIYPTSNAWLSLVKLYGLSGVQTRIFTGEDLIFGAGERIDSLEILWPDSTRITVFDIKPDTFYSFNMEALSLKENETVEDTGFLKLYPNPTSALVSLEYTVEKPCFVKLELINTGGQTLYLIDSGYKDAGVHRLIFNAEDFKPGTYFIRAVVGEKSIRKKLIVLK